MRALALLPLSAIAVFPPSLLAVYELGQKSSSSPILDSERSESVVMNADSDPTLKQAQAIAAKPKLLTPQPSPEAKTVPQFSSIRPSPPVAAVAQKSVDLDPAAQVASLSIDQIVSQSLGTKALGMQAKSTSPAIAAPPARLPVATESAKSISPVEVAAPVSTPAPPVIPAETAPSSIAIPIEPSLSIPTEPSLSIPSLSATISPTTDRLVDLPPSISTPADESENLPIAADSVPTSVVAEPPEMIAQVEVTPQALPTFTPAPSGAVPLSIQTEPSISTPNPLGGASVDETYALGAGDRIQITLLNVPEYSGPQQVLADGSVNLPLIGKVSIKGMTLPVAEAAIASRYEPELRHSIVTVVLVQPRPLRIAIAGEVQKPGSYTLPLAEGEQFPSLAQAIQGAGGVTQAANLHQVQVRRQQAGSNQVITVNLWELLRNGDQNQNLALRDGDTIVIAAATEVNTAETAQLADSNLAASASQAFDVAIVGEIVRPGAYKVGATGDSETSSDRPRITQVIQLAGGVKPTADLRQVQVRRLTRNGSEQIINVDFWQLLQAGDSSQNLILQEGDTITIPLAQTTTAAEASQLASANLSPDAIQINVIGEVKTPGALPLPANTTLNQALLAAGGLNDRSAREVELIRLNPNGTITQQRIKVDLREGIDAESNPILWNNDIIIAGRSRSAQLGDRLNSILGPFLQLISPIRGLF